MADLGNIGVLLPDSVVLYGGVISGVVLDSSASPAVRVVRGTHRKTGAASGCAISRASDGAYALYTNISYGKEKHTVTEFDNATGESFNARVFDNITPL